MILEVAALAVGAFGVVFGASAWALARRWAHDCATCRIIIARKGKVQLDAPLTEWLAWNRALPKRERSRGGVIFQANGVQVALARPKIGAPAAKTETRTVKPPGAGTPSSEAAA